MVYESSTTEKEEYLKATQEAITAANEYLKIPSLMSAEDFIR